MSQKPSSSLLSHDRPHDMRPTLLPFITLVVVALATAIVQVRADGDPRLIEYEPAGTGTWLESWCHGLTKEYVLDSLFQVFSPDDAVRVDVELVRRGWRCPLLVTSAMQHMAGNETNIETYCGATADGYMYRSIMDEMETCIANCHAAAQVNVVLQAGMRNPDWQDQCD